MDSRALDDGKPTTPLVVAFKIIDRQKLLTLLKNRGSEYSIEVQHNEYHIYSDVILNENDLRGCYYEPVRPRAQDRGKAPVGESVPTPTPRLVYVL